MDNSIFEQLQRDALYAQKSFSTELLYQAYGGAKMARRLEAITEEEFLEINRMTVYFMNTDAEYIRQKNQAFWKGKTVKEYRVKFWHQDEDGREDYMEFDTGEQAREFYDSLGGMAEIQKWNEELHNFEAEEFPTFEF